MVPDPLRPWRSGRDYAWRLVHAAARESVLGRSCPPPASSFDFFRRRYEYCLSMVRRPPVWSEVGGHARPAAAIRAGALAERHDPSSLPAGPRRPLRLSEPLSGSLPTHLPGHGAKVLWLTC